MGQNQNRPPRDTPAQQMGRTQPEKHDPLGQDKALRAMEMIAHDMLNAPSDDEGPPPGSDVYFELLKRAGVPTDALKAHLAKGGSVTDMPPVNELIRNYGEPQDDEFYGQDVTPDNVERMNKLEPWVIPNINRIADKDAGVISHRGYVVPTSSEPRADGQYNPPTTRYLETISQEVNDQQVHDRTFHYLLENLLGKGQR